jgi:hypothetical protein
MTGTIESGQWLYSRCYCNVTIGARDWTYYGNKCAACGNTNLRFLHVLKHIVARKEITVGIECARNLVFKDQRDLPQLAENETARKERWRLRYGNYGLCVTTVEELEVKGKL